MTTLLRAPYLLTLSALLFGCSGEGVHLPRPDLRAARATISQPAAPAVVELLAQNPTDAPLWLRRLDITLSAQGSPIAAGIWEGDRLIDPGARILLDLSLPLIDNAPIPTTDTRGNLLVKTRYARSGILGVMGGETFTYELPVLIHPAD